VCAYNKILPLLFYRATGGRPGIPRWEVLGIRFEFCCILALTWVFTTPAVPPVWVSSLVFRQCFCSLFFILVGDSVPVGYVLPITACQSCLLGLIPGASVYCGDICALWPGILLCVSGCGRS
jgi:hypothetical protein